MIGVPLAAGVIYPAGARLDASWAALLMALRYDAPIQYEANEQFRLCRSVVASSQALQTTQIVTPICGRNKSMKNQIVGNSVLEGVYIYGDLDLDYRDRTLDCDRKLCPPIFTSSE